MGVKIFNARRADFDCDSLDKKFFSVLSQKEKAVCWIERSSGLVIDSSAVVDSIIEVDQGFVGFQNNIILKLDNQPSFSIQDQYVFDKNIKLGSISDVENSFIISSYENFTNTQLDLSPQFYFADIGKPNTRVRIYGRKNLFGIKAGYRYGLLIFDQQKDTVFFAIGA